MPDEETAKKDEPEQDDDLDIDTDKFYKD